MDAVLFTRTDHSVSENLLLSSFLASLQLLPTSFVKSSLIAQDTLRGSFPSYCCSNNSWLTFLSTGFLPSILLGTVHALSWITSPTITTQWVLLPSLSWGLEGLKILLKWHKKVRKVFRPKSGITAYTPTPLFVHTSNNRVLHRIVNVGLHDNKPLSTDLALCLYIQST